jgi:glycosyltransferase involved in cell wall biosynthesis
VLNAPSASEPAAASEADPARGAALETALRQSLELGLQLARRQLGGQPCHLALPFPVPERIARRLLGLPGVAGLILRAPSDALLRDHAATTGGWAGGRGTEWRLPAELAPHIVFFGRRAEIGPRILRACLQRRVRTLTFVEPWSGLCEHRSTLALLPPVLADKLRDRLTAQLRVQAARRLFAPGSRLRRSSERLHRAAFPLGRRLRRMLEAGRELRLPPEAFDRRRVLYAIGTLGPGGAERQLVNTVLGMQQRGRVPIVVCTDLNAPRARFFCDRLRAHDVPVTTWRELLPAAMSIETADAIGRLHAELRRLPADLAEAVTGFLVILRCLRPGVVHAFLDDINLQAGLAAALAGVPRIVLGARSVAPINFALFKPMMAPCYKVLLDQPGVVLLNNSMAGAEDYRAWLRRPRQGIRVLYNGYDPSQLPPAPAAGLRAQLGLAGDALLVGGAMRMTEEKGPLLWAEAAVAIARAVPRARFVLAGDGPLLGRVKTILAEGGIAERVHLPGHVADIAGLLAGLDLFLLTSRKEGLPNVLIEAQALGVPVVTTVAGGAVEALEPEVTGLIAPERSATSVAAACIRLLSDDVLRARMAGQAPAFVERRFGLERMLDETLAVYLGRPGGGGPGEPLPNGG